MATKYDGQGRPYSAPGSTAAAAGDQMSGAIASQLLGIANDTGTHTVGHAGYTIDRSADRGAAKGRFAGYSKDARAAARAAARTVLGRDKGIRASYTRAATAETDRAADLAAKAETQIAARDTGYLKAADDLGLSAVPMSESRADKIQDALTGRSNAIASSWAGFDRNSGRRATERNDATADSILASGRSQQVALNGLLENVLAGLQDKTVASTLRTVQDTSLSQRLQALTGLRYLNKDQQTNDLNQQKLLASLTPSNSTSTTTQYGTNGSVIGSSKTVRTR